MEAIVLSLVVCAAVSGECRQQVVGEGFSTPVACLMEGEVDAEKWLNTHPGWRLASWRCGREERAL